MLNCDHIKKEGCCRNSSSNLNLKESKKTLKELFFSNDEIHAGIAGDTLAVVYRSANKNDSIRSVVRIYSMR